MHQQGVFRVRLTVRVFVCVRRVAVMERCFAGLFDVRREEVAMEGDVEETKRRDGRVELRSR